MEHIRKKFPENTLSWYGHLQRKGEEYVGKLEILGGEEWKEYRSGRPRMRWK